MAELWAVDDLPGIDWTDLTHPRPAPGPDIPEHLDDRPITTIHVLGDLL
ncbi:hypothetical protein QD712_25675 [Streptomyces acidiscabies]